MKLIHEKKLEAENLVEEKRVRVERGGRWDCGGRERRKRDKEGRVHDEEGGGGRQSTDSEAKF